LYVHKPKREQPKKEETKFKKRYATNCQLRQTTVGVSYVPPVSDEDMPMQIIYYLISG
jgi:hypothetical protein